MVGDGHQPKSRGLYMYILYAQYKDSYQVLDHHLHIRSLDHGTFAGPDATDLKRHIIYLSTFYKRIALATKRFPMISPCLIVLVDITHILSCLRFAPQGTSHLGWEETAAEAAGLSVFISLRCCIAFGPIVSHSIKMDVSMFGANKCSLFGQKLVWHCCTTYQIGA